MKSERFYQITFTEEEGIALRKILGQLSDNEKMEKGLSGEQCTIVSEIYGLLPLDED
jgi:hypothetical protein